MWHIFRCLELTVKITTFTTHSTTHLPSKNHVLHPVFCKTPCKNHTFPPDKKIARAVQRERRISLWRGLVRSAWSAALRPTARPQPLPERLTPPLPTPARYEQDSGAVPS